MADFNIELMEELCMTPGISSHEEKIAEIIKRELKDVANDIEVDHMGNVFATKKGSSKKGPTVMLASHMDEIGLMVVTIHTADGEITGVIGSKPPHVTKPEERKKVIPADDMFIDIGAKDKEEAESMVSIGDAITFKSWFASFPNNRIMGKALDNRIGCYVMMEVLKRVDSKATVVGVGTVQEEVGLKGARVSAFKIDPDYAFALDTTLSGDHPGIKPEEAPCVLGKGPAVVLIDASGRGIMTPKVIRDMLVNAGDKYEIPYQLEVSDGGTTDGTSIHLAKEGIPTGVLSVPTRYIHTPVSVASFDDIESTIELIVAAINDLE